MTKYYETVELLLDKGHEADDVGIIGNLFKSCMQLLKLSLLKVRETYFNKTSINSLESSMATLFCWGDELGVPRGDLDDALQYSEETRDLTLAVLISLGEFLSHDLISILSQPDRKEILQKCQISEQIEKAKSMTTDWEDAVFEGAGNVEDLLATLKAEVARLSVLGQILEDPVPTFVDVEEARAIGLLEERSAHQYYADMISARFPQAKNSLTEILGKCNWVRYNRIQKQREENACREPTPVGDGESKSKFQDSGLGTTIPAQSHGANGYAETVFSKRAEMSHKRLPPLPEEGRGGKSFLCSVCNRIVDIQQSQTWKKHVFTDILAYVCIFDNCPFDRDFFEDQDAMTVHLGVQHGFAEEWQSQECPLCLEQTGSGRNTVSLHFSRHMEEIALGVLPCTTELDEESDTSSLQEENISTGSGPLNPDHTQARSDAGTALRPLTPSAMSSHRAHSSSPSGGRRHSISNYCDGSLPSPSEDRSSQNGADGADVADGSRSFIKENNAATKDLMVSRPPMYAPPDPPPFVGSRIPPVKGGPASMQWVRPGLNRPSTIPTKRELQENRKASPHSPEIGNEDASGLPASILPMEKGQLSRHSEGPHDSLFDALLFGDSDNKKFTATAKRIQQAEEDNPSDIGMTAKQTESEQEANGNWEPLPPTEPLSERDIFKSWRNSDLRGRRMMNPRETDDPFPFAGDAPSSPLSSTGGRGLSPSSTGREIISPILPPELGSKTFAREPTSFIVSSPERRSYSSSSAGREIIPPPFPSELTNKPPTQGLSTKGFKCDHPRCNAPPFQTQYLLNSHANVHNQDRPHYCPVAGCPRGEGGKGFKRKNEMIRHGLVHDSPGYVCPFCPDREHKYPRPDNLMRHVRNHHVDKAKDDPHLREVLAQRPEKESRR